MNKTLLFFFYISVFNLPVFGQIQLVKDINPGVFNSYPRSFYEYQGKLFFVAGTAYGNELWYSDGTEAGTLMLKDINPVGDAISGTTIYGILDGYLYFVAYTDVGGGLFKTDGTEAGTSLVKNIAIGTSNLYKFCKVNNVLFFSGNDGTGFELWKTDGTEAGTVMVKDIHTTGASYPYMLTELNGKVYFQADDGGTTYGYELWVSDGTEGGTHVVKDITSGPAGTNFSNLTNIAGTLFFSYDGVLWKSDGTEVGTVIVSSTIAPSSDFIEVNGILYFAGSATGTGIELCRSDGTNNGTYMVKDINPGSTSSYPAFMVNNNGILYFSANNGTNGVELWKSDGTNSGTVMVRDNNNGTVNFHTIAFNNKVFNNGFNSSIGEELCESDGTFSGTICYDINPGTFYSQPIHKLGIGSTLFIGAQSQTEGNELYKLNVPQIINAKIKENENKFLEIFPNPIILDLNVELFEKVIDNIKIINNMGQEIFSIQNINSSKTQINFSDFPKGFYTCIVTSGENNYVKKVIKI